MAKYLYPAIFEMEESGLISVVFPDLQGCYTCGDNLEHAYEMAEDALAFWLYNREEDGEDIPQSSNVVDVGTHGNAFVSLVTADTMEYRRMYHNTAVKKTLSIPSWLNEMAERAGVNYSQLLQAALKKKLHIR